ncbi:MAG TPA: hypothetical protein VGF14_00020 [Alphaproteobacteria bacterium]
MAKYILLFLFLLMAGSIAFLGLSRVPAPTQPVEKTISNDKFFAK